MGIVTIVLILISFVLVPIGLLTLLEDKLGRFLLDYKVDYRLH